MEELTLSEELAAAAIEQVDFIDNDLETSFEAALVAYGKLQRTAMEIDALTPSDVSIKEVSRGVLGLARQFGVTFKNLATEQADAVKSLIRQVVTGANELLIERFFDESLDTIVKVQALNTTVDDITAPEEE